jgi:hypothetical protein
MCQSAHCAPHAHTQSAQCAPYAPGLGTRASHPGRWFWRVRFPRQTLNSGVWCGWVLRRFTALTPVWAGTNQEFMMARPCEFAGFNRCGTAVVVSRRLRPRPDLIWVWAVGAEQQARALGSMWRRREGSQRT